MPKITYIEHSGKSHTINVAKELTVMEGAVQNDIPGIDADCGGACACATCHAYIDPKWVPKLSTMDDMEDSMLDAAYERRDNSRLTCQIEVTNELDGLVVHIAENEC